MKIATIFFIAQIRSFTLNKKYTFQANKVKNDWSIITIVLTFNRFTDIFTREQYFNLTSVFKWPQQTTLNQSRDILNNSQ